MTANSCESNFDAINQGTNQDQRVSEQLKPEYVKVDERKIEYAMVFAKTYAQYWKFYDSNDKATGDWQAFFSRDVSVQLATVAIENVEYYKINIKKSFDFLNNPKNENREDELKNQLGYLFSCIATLAKQLDVLKESLPTEISLKLTLQTLIKNQLASELKQSILYYRDGKGFTHDKQSQLYLLNNVKPKFDILEAMSNFKEVIEHEKLSTDWIFKDTASSWADYLSNLKNPEKYPPTKIYGSGDTIFKQLNHIATHNQFKAIFDQFLKAFARVVSEAKVELEETLSKWDKYQPEPHYALFLAFLKLFDYAKLEINTLTERHLDFYYRDILKLKEKPAEPSHAHLLIELAKLVDTHEFKTGELFSAGKDASKREIFFANQQSFVANQAKVTELKTIYQHKNDSSNKTDDNLTGQNNYLFASPIANSADGLGAKLSIPDQSWHPFFNKIYENDKLSKINMQPAEIGFAIASHYLWLAEGIRTITIEFILPTNKKINLAANQEQIICLLSTEKGWFEKAATKFAIESNVLKLEITLSGADPAITPYSTKTHDYNFSSNLPMLLVKLRHQENIVIETINLTVNVTGLKSLAVSNDFGAIDTSKPFQPFGALPVANSALIIGSKEIFQKTLSKATININWQNPPNPYNTVNITIDYLQAGQWKQLEITDNNSEDDIPDKSFKLSSEDIKETVIDKPDFSTSEYYNTNSKQGFVRLKIDNDFGQNNYEQNLIRYLKNNNDGSAGKVNKKPIPPIGPFIAELSLDYTTAKQTIYLNSDQATFENRSAKFFHLTPFGHCEPHGLLNCNKEVTLIPHFDNAEFYIGITGLKAAQNLALLFQVAEGSADPLVERSNIQWSYLTENEWIEFKKSDVQDNTNDLINSGVITFAMPDKINSTNTLLPTGQYWLRAAVTGNSEAVCKLLAVSAQSLKVTFKNQNNDPHFLENALPAESISKLKQPDAEVKKISQPFASFGGRAAEQKSAFYTRVSERLRHKDRSITLWDYEHLILEAFPQIYCVKCLNHTQYELKLDGSGYIFNELAPGHITIVTIPNQPFQNRHDPFLPYSSIGLLTEIETFLQKRLPCFAKLHIKNPLFEEVRVGFDVKFRTNIDKDFYKQKLNTAITQFLSPWAFSEKSYPTFGGKVYLSTLINFVEEQDYVDYVTNFSFITSEEPNPKVLRDTKIVGSKAISILVSAKHHKIQNVDSNDSKLNLTNSVSVNHYEQDT
jgi:hypothetical protein